MLSPLYSVQPSALINSTLHYITITLEHIITLTLLPFKAEVSASSSHSPCINKENQAAGCAKTYNLSSHKIVINYVRALSWGISQCIMFQYLIPYQLKERMGI